MPVVVAVALLAWGASGVAAAAPTTAERLGGAYLALAEGRFADARAEAKLVLAGKPKNRDYALWIAAQAAYLDGDRAAALPLFRELGKAKGSRFREAAAWRAADCLFDLGKLDDARKQYEKLLPGAAGDPAVALHRVAAAHDAAGRTARAKAARRRLVLEHPAHPLARASEASVTLAAADRLARAERLTSDRAWMESLDELAAIGDDEPAATRTLRDYWTGTTLFRMRRQYQRAAGLLIDVHDEMGGRAAEALFHGARAYSRADQDDDAIRWYGEVVRKYPRSSQAAEAQFLIGWLDFNRGRWREALPGLQATLDDHGRSSWAVEARWYLGLARWLLGEPAEALPLFEKLAARSGALDGGKGTYWQARALSELGQPAEARALLREVVTRWPFTWYALLARARLAELGVSVGPFGDGGTGRAPALPAPTAALDREPALARVDELIAAGLGPEAGFELDRAEPGLVKKHRKAGALAAVLDRYRRAGNFHRPWMLAIVHGDAAFDLEPQGDARPWWEHAYPLAYRELIEAHRALGDNPPYYLYAIMQKESGYDPHVESYADALGLLQMIPPTTKRVAPILGLAYTDDLLFDPELNVKTGSWYIGHLLGKFKGQIPIGAGSFNSGPRPVMRWLDQFGDRPTDEFVELVAYTQTREYMKKVAGIYARYQYLYDGTVYEQPLRVDREYVKDDLIY